MLQKSLLYELRKLLDSCYKDRYYPLIWMSRSVIANLKVKQSDSFVKWQIEAKYPEITTIISRVVFSLYWWANNSALVYVHSFAGAVYPFHKNSSESNGSAPFWWHESFMRLSAWSASYCELISDPLFIIRDLPTPDVIEILIRECTLVCRYEDFHWRMQTHFHW